MIRNEVFSCFVFYGVLLVIKMYIIAIITGQVRLRKKVSDSCRWTWNSKLNPSTEQLSLMKLSFLKGFCQPWRRAETRRFTVPQRGSRRGEMPEVRESAESLVNRKSYCHDKLWLGKKYLTCILWELHRAANAYKALICTNKTTIRKQRTFFYTSHYYAFYIILYFLLNSFYSRILLLLL